MADPGVMAWGSCRNGELGHGRARDDIPHPSSIQLMESCPVISLSCGQFHTATLVVSGGVPQLYTWGRGALGLLGHGDEEDYHLPRPVRALRSIEIRSISCGTYHMAAVSNESEVFTWGWRLDCTAGTVEESYCTLPQRVEALAHAQV